MEILLKADLLRLEEIISKKLKEERRIDSQIESNDKKILRRQNKRSCKKYNMTQAARILGVHRQTLYYWIRKGWLSPKRDYRNYPVCTVLDIENLIQWRNSVK